MDKATLSLLFLGIYFAVVLGVSWFVRTRKEAHDAGFAIGGRNVGFWATTGSLVSGNRDGGGLAVWVTIGASLMFGFYWLIIGFAVALILHIIQLKYVRPLAEKHNFITQADMIRSLIGPKTERGFSYVLILFAIPYAALQLYVSGQILSSLTGLSLVFGVGISAILVGIYLFWGGYQTLVVTDLLQWIILAAILLLPYILLQIPTDIPVIENFLADGSFNFGIAGVGFLWGYCTPEIWQRMFSVKSVGVGRKSLIATILIFPVITIGLTLFGLYLAGIFPAMDSKELYYQVFAQAPLPPLTLALAGITCIAITMSTLDTQTYLFTSTVSKNIMKIDNVKDHDKYVRWNRILMIGFLATLSLVAMGIYDLIKFMIDTALIISVFLPFIVYALVFGNADRRCSDKQLSFALYGGAILYLGMFFGDSFTSLLHNLIPAAATSAFVILLHITMRGTESAKA